MVGATWFFMAVATLLTHDVLVLTWFDDSVFGDAVWRIYVTTMGMAVWSHLRGAFSDPGYIPAVSSLEASASNQNIRLCKKCDAWKPARAHHCRTCGKCVFRLDHFCVFLNNAVGYKNQKYFILFLFYSFLASLFILILAAVNLLMWWRSDVSLNPLHALGGGLVAAEGAFFAWFTGDFLAEQIESLRTNTTLVETYQETRGAKDGGLLENFKEIFGNEAVWWPVPVYSSKPPDYWEPVLKVVVAN
jgi:palmitoyltransferase